MWMQAVEGISHKAELRRTNHIISEEGAMNREPKPLTKVQQEFFKSLLPKAVKPFVHDGWDHVTDAKRYYEVWFELPGMTEQYASLGFTTDPDAPYWTVPMPSRAVIERYKAAGYGDDYKRYLWRYVELPDEFWSMQEGRQVAWLTKYMEGSLKEDERLRGM